ncbi:hypothetical protein, partial [Xanthomonas campestris]|uniref:hypothetical protein n=1 Tax=Xanthomonas campestris TaxID=339 RepID=UPI001E4AD8D3
MALIGRRVQRKVGRTLPASVWLTGQGPHGGPCRYRQSRALGAAAGRPATATTTTVATAGTGAGS